MRIFVFGSNLGGQHAGGAAADAVRQHGAIWGQGVGLQGQSYAIPTMDASFRRLPLSSIFRYVEEFLVYARARYDLTFQVTRIGCGIAGYADREIGPMFRGAPANCELPEGWGR